MLYARKFYLRLQPFYSLCVFFLGLKRLDSQGISANP